MSTAKMHGTTILSVRRGNRVVIGGDGQVTLGDTTMKGNARKVRRLHEGKVIAGFAGGTADAFTLFERFEGKLQKHQGNLTRAAVELSKDWRTDRMLRRLEALLAAPSQTCKFKKICAPYNSTGGRTRGTVTYLNALSHIYIYIGNCS